jgi:ComF family protein
LFQLLGAASARGELVALVDALDMLDVESAAEVGIDLDRLLWIRGFVVPNPGLCRDLNQRALVQAILLLKYEQIEPLGAWFAERLAEVVKEQGSALAADVVVPVPLHRQRERERGYNQAALLSKPLAKRLGLPHKAALLMRTRARPEKQILTLEERWESVRGAFATRPGSQVDNLRVLLLDDVLTTGATLDACARALLEAGAKSVVGLTVARAARNPLPSSSEW